jgi:hypothetical protein
MFFDFGARTRRHISTPCLDRSSTVTSTDLERIDGGRCSLEELPRFLDGQFLGL